MLTWFIIFGVVALIAFYATRMARLQEESNRHDPGLAIIEFGRAFPNEAIRSLHETVDGNAVFVRLHDNKAGIMRSHKSHYACHLIEPGRVRVEPLPTGRGFNVQFLDAPTQNGTFIFSSVEDAAEVSLWLLGNLVAPGRAMSNADGADGLDGSSL